MLALMFDPKFKGMQIVINFFNNPKLALELVVKYDQKVFLTLLTKAYKEVHLEMPQTLPHIGLLHWKIQCLVLLQTLQKQVRVC